MILSVHGIIASSGGVSFDADYQAILDYATTQGYTLPSSGQQTLQNQLVVDLKTAGVWSDLDLFYVFATDGDEDFATINWANPNAFQCSKVNSPTFTSNVGFIGDQTSSYLNTNYNVSSDSVNFELLSNSLHYYYSDSVGAVHHGARVANDINQILYGFELKRHQGNSTNFPIINTGTNSFFSSIRNGSSTEQYTNNTLTATRTNTPTTLPNINYFLLCVNENGSAAFNGTAYISFFTMGGQISNSAMYNAWNNYYTSL